MDLRDLVKLAGIVNPEVLNKLEPTAEVEEADGAGFEDATTRPQEEMMDDPMATMGSDADLSLRRYLKAKGDHVTVDEEIYPDHTVESVTEAYESFKAESATPNMDKEIAAYFKQIKTPAKGWGGKLKAESNDIDEADVDEGNAYSGALAKAKAAGADEFEVDGKVHKVKEGAVKDAMIDDAEKMSKAAFIKKYGEENAGTWESVNESLDEGAKPDYIDIDGDGDKEESMKKAAKDKEEDEEVDESLDILKTLAGIK